MLRNKIPKILEHIRYQYENNIIFNKKILDVYDGQLVKYVDEALQASLSATSYYRSKTLITDVNLTKQFVEKTNRTYNKPATRKVLNDNPIDKELLTKAEKNLKFNKRLNEIATYLTLHGNSALQLSLENGKEVLRSLDATKFLVWSDDVLDQNNPTVFIKFMGQRPKEYMQVVDQEGKLLRAAIHAVKDVNIFHLFDKDTFIEIDEDGDISIEQPNEFGFIPFVYCRNNDRSLINPPDIGLLKYPILVNCQLTSLNYAQKMQSHTILYGINLKNMGDMTLAPDILWDLQAADTGDQAPTPSVGTLAPSVDANAVISTISSEMKMWLESRGLKVNSQGTASTDNASSGVSKIIDESDASSIRNAKATLMAEIEEELLNMYKKMRDVWAKQGRLVEDKRPFSTDATFSIEFAEQKPFKDFKTSLEEQKLMLDMGIATPKMALKNIYPEKTDEEIDLLMTEIEAEKQKNFELNQEVLNNQNNKDNNFKKPIEENDESID